MVKQYAKTNFGPGVAVTGEPNLPLQIQFAQGMLEMAPQDGIGMALSYLLMMSIQQPEMLRTVLNEKVVREGFVGVSMIETLNRICR